MGTFIRSLRTRQGVAAVLITAITLALIGVVLVAATPVGCGPANALGLKTVASRCARQASNLSPAPPSPTINPTQQPSPSPALSPSASPSTTPDATPSSLPTNTQPPDGQPASGAYPPFYPAASVGTGTPAYSLNCRLPIYAGQAGSGGFLVLPGGTFIADPGSAVTLPSPPPGTASPTPPPQAGPGGYPGFYGLSYDRQLSRWLPVPNTWVAPDGSRYVFPSTDGIYVVAVSAGTVSEIGSGKAWNIVGVQAAGVYAMQPNAAGLWLLSFAGTVTEVTTAGFWQAVGAQAAYGTMTSAVPQGVANTIVRFDLAAGSLTSWFTRGGAQGYVVGVDASGRAIINVSYFNNNGGNEIWIATAAGSAIPVIGSQYEGLSTTGTPISDANGVWLPVYNQYAYGNTQQQIVLYVEGKGVYGITNIGGSLAGGCS
jgi:hypothetical protein